MTRDGSRVTASAEALFRYQVVSMVLSLEFGGQGKDAAISRVAGMGHRGPRGEPRSVSRRTLYRWLAGFEIGGVAGLEPAAATFFLEATTAGSRSSSPRSLKLPFESITA